MQQSRTGGEGAGFALAILLGVRGMRGGVGVKKSAHVPYQLDSQKMKMKQKLEATIKRIGRRQAGMHHGLEGWLLS